MKSVDSHLKDFARIELCNLVLGEKLGEGVYRDVYAHALDPSLVIKVEMEKGSFANIMEWEFWQHNFHDPKVSKFLAPCLHISDSGLVLLQRRTIPLMGNKGLPKKVPALLGDIHTGNWGYLGVGGPVVCHDYGSLNLSRGSNPTKLRSVNWS